MQLAIHSSDVSYPCRDFGIVKEWTYLVFEEFFNQGDIEKNFDLPVSMLCDREKINVPKSQPGFINFVVLPLFTNLSNVIPMLNEPDGVLERMRKNLQAWKEYQESEEDKKIYEFKQINQPPTAKSYI